MKNMISSSARIMAVISLLAASIPMAYSQIIYNSEGLSLTGKCNSDKITTLGRASIQVEHFGGLQWWCDDGAKYIHIDLPRLIPVLQEPVTAWFFTIRTKGPLI